MNDISNCAASRVPLFFVVFLVTEACHFYMEDVKTCKRNPLIFSWLTWVNIIQEFI